jgi:hypothetical protein
MKKKPLPKLKPLANRCAVFLLVERFFSHLEVALPIAE